MCEIKVVGIQGIGPVPDRILVWGTVSDCADLPDGEHVFVDIVCGDGDSVLVQGAPADSSGDDWDLIVDVPPESECKCGAVVTATARCASDDSCSGELTTELRCPDCPRVEITAPEPGSTTCNPDGSASVPLEAKIINSTPVDILAIIECGPGGTLDPQSSAPTVGVTTGDIQFVTAICRYPTPAEPKPFIRFGEFSDGEVEIGCAPVPFDAFKVDCLCPKVVNLETSVEGCTATFTGTLEPAVEGCQFRWVFGDGAEIITSIPEAQHTYQSTNPDFPSGWPVSVVVECPNCDSPEITNTVAPVTDCSDSGNGGDGEDDPDDCWWCGAVCSALLGLALAAILAAVILIVAAGCTMLATPWIWISAIAAAVAGLAALGAWAWLCKNFVNCGFLCTTITIVKIAIVVQAIIAVALSILQSLGWIPTNWGCIIGAVVALAYLGLVLVILLQVNQAADCGCEDSGD